MDPSVAQGRHDWSGVLSLLVGLAHESQGVFRTVWVRSVCEMHNRSWGAPSHGDEDRDLLAPHRYDGG